MLKNYSHNNNKEMGVSSPLLQEIISLMNFSTPEIITDATPQSFIAEETPVNAYPIRWRPLYISLFSNAVKALSKFLTVVSASFTQLSTLIFFNWKPMNNPRKTCTHFSSDGPFVTSSDAWTAAKYRLFTLQRKIEYKNFSVIISSYHNTW